jgi:hypothetical protein
MNPRSPRSQFLHPEIISNVFSLSELLALPLKAVIDANFSAVMSALELLLKFGFENPVEKLPRSDEFVGSLRTMTFTYDYTDARGQRQATKVSVPLISLIPMPLLEVTKAHFDYAIRILNEQTLLTEKISDDAMVASRSVVAMLAPIDTTRADPARIAGKSGPKANMTVHLEVEKSDLPAGILKLLNLGEQAISGVMEEKLVIHNEPDKLLFDRNDLPLSLSPYKLRVEVRKPCNHGSTSGLRAEGSQGSTWETVPDRDVQLEVFSNTGRLTELFTRPILVTAGDVIGIATYFRAAARTNEDGLVEFALWPDLSASDSNNGFVVIKTKMADDKALYFGFV